VSYNKAPTPGIQFTTALPVDLSSALPVIGFLNGGTAEGYAPMVAAFRQDLNEAGYVEGRNVAIEYRYTERFG
jgi:hypothetical protein